MNKRILLVLVALACAIVLVSPVYAANVASSTNTGSNSHNGGGFNTPGNVLISDQFNKRIVEVNQQKQIVWSFGSNDPTPTGCPAKSDPRTIIGSNWAERLAGGLTVIAGTGIPGGGADPLMPNGCVDNRVIVVNQNGHVVWQYGQYGVTGSGRNELSVPVAVIQLPNGNFLITDQSNNRIIEVSLIFKRVVWSYGPTSPPGALNSPNSAELLPNGHILIADEGNNRVIEITRTGHIVWEWDNPLGTAIAFASRLPNGNTLITDAGSARIIEVTHNKKIVFEYFTNTDPLSNPAPAPTNAVKLKNGDISIADQFNNRAFIIDPVKSDPQSSPIDFQ
jgi:hypothetical protein